MFIHPNKWREKYGTTRVQQYYVCPVCKEATKPDEWSEDKYSCINCGNDIEQKVNGKISYIPHVMSKKDNTDGKST